MPAEQKQKPWLSLCVLLSLGFIWGTGYSIARFAMTHGVPPLGYSLWQSIGPAFVIGLFAFARSTHFIFRRSHLRYYFICGLTGIALPNTAMYFAAPHLPAGILAMVVNIAPVIAYPLALLAKLEYFSWQRLSGLVLAICGLLLIMLPHTSLPSHTNIPWVLFLLIAPFCFAFCSIYIAKCRPVDSEVLALTAGMLIFSSLMLMPVALATHQYYLFHFPLTAPDGVVLLEIILSSIGYLLLFQLIKMAGPVYYSFVDTIVVLTGLFWGHLLFNEALNKWTATAVFLILFALLIVTQHQRTAAALRHPRTVD